MLKILPWTILGIAIFVLSPQAKAFVLLEDYAGWMLDDGPVGYFIDSTGSDDIADDSEIEAIKNSFHSWECLECSALQLRYDGDAPVRATGDDGINVVYFVEDEADWPFGPGTMSSSILGVCTHTGPTDADVVFNGVHHTWSTSSSPGENPDVESISLHETGHFVGLDHPCTDDADPATCVPASQAVMFPMYSGGLMRAPLPDDTAGVCELYKDTPGKKCDQGLVSGSRCEMNCECEKGLTCVKGEDGNRYCAPSCDASNPKCHKGMACVLASRGGNVEMTAQGSCMKIANVNALPAGAICNRPQQCATNDCSLVRDIGRDVCRQSCASNEQCADNQTCATGSCINKGPDRGVPCPVDEPEEPGCGCNTTATPLGYGALLLLAVGMLVRSRRHWTLPLLGVALLLSSSSKATVVEAMDLDRMIELSDVIVHGRVLSVRVQEPEDRGLIFTVVEVLVDDAIKGVDNEQKVTFLVPGGSVGDRRQIIPGTSTFTPGEEVVLFLSRWRDQLVQVAVGVGKFAVDRNNPEDPRVRDQVGADVAFRYGSSGNRLGVREAIADISLDDFISELRLRVQR